MQKKYNIGALLQCAKEEDDNEWRGKDKKQQNQP
jgi:hypothetical protein